jgi:hypothetical protein
MFWCFQNVAFFIRKSMQKQEGNISIIASQDLRIKLAAGL